MKPDRIRSFVPVAILLIATSLRVGGLCKFALNNDEIAELTWAQQSWSAMMQSVSNDRVHPPLDYIVQHCMDSISIECLRRIPAVLAGIATVALIMHIALRAFGWGAGKAAGFLLSLSPAHIRYSQEIRPYAIGLFALTAAISALLEYRHTSQRRWAVLWFVSLLTAAYTLYFAALVAVITSAALIFFERKDRLNNLWRHMPQLVAAALILYLPWMRVVIAAIRQPPFAARDQLNAAWFSYRLQVLGTGDWQVEPISIGSYILWTLAAAGCFIAWRSAAGRSLVFWLVGGFAAEILILQVHPHLSAVRHLLPAWLAVFPLAGAAIAAISRWRAAPIGVLICAVIAAADARTLRAYYDHGRPDWREAANFVASRIRRNERIFAGNGRADLNFGYYWRQAGTLFPLERLPTNVQLTLTGPAWIVTAGCLMDDVARASLDHQELRFARPYTNHCQIHYLRSGTTIALPHGVCSAE